MKQWKALTLGFVAGAACMVTTSAIAANYPSIMVKLFSDASFVVDGKAVTPKADQQILNYNDYTYVPLRFVAENVGAQILWNPETKLITLTSPEPKVVEKIVEKEVEKIVYVDKKDDSGTTVYSKLPVTSEQGEYRVTLRNVQMDPDDPDDWSGPKWTRLNLTLENIDYDYPIQLHPFDAKLILDGKEYTQPVNLGLWDSKWTQEYLEKEDKQEGFLIFDDIKPDYKTGTLEFQVKLQTAFSYEYKTIKIDFKK